MTSRIARILIVTGLLLAALLVLGSACSDSDSNGDGPDATEDGATADPDATEDPNATVDPNASGDPDGDGSGSGPTPTEDPVASETRSLVRDVESGARRLQSQLRRLETQVARAPAVNPGTPSADEDEDEEIHWFEECCEDAPGDFGEEISEMRRALDELEAIYSEAGDDESLDAVGAIEASLANIEASIQVLPTLPAAESAASVLDDIEADVEAIGVATADLR